MQNAELNRKTPARRYSGTPIHRYPETPIRKFGWLPDLPDRRDVPFRNVFRVPGKLPELVDLRSGCSPIENQGDLGSCTAQALVAALEFLELRSLPASSDKIGNRQSKIQNSFADLSRLFVYYNERARQGTIAWDSGAMLRTGIKVLKNAGVCRESKWSYDISKFRDKPSADCYKEGLDHQITAYQRLATLAEMKSCLAMGLPFVFGFSVYESAMSSDVAKSGDIPMPSKGESLLGGHAIMAVGYDDAKQKIIFRNSWGINWGNAGYGTLPYIYLENRDLSDDFWCIQGTESNLYARRLESTPGGVKGPGVKTDSQIV